ncbi:GAF domain-containing protein [Rhodocytophaga aerolata]|uniref:GAF domain-containing protein n=1 Tax=Rhodocytophaga aerolata TaxID=455078 RepID=A0ABT8REF1_9BACT|nr:GAF domain-containing protein [Rhodocytophaga aerolata]MDO1450364.1 GAF domain-containing protein [Rhodocytophaga aerolata]
MNNTRTNKTTSINSFIQEIDINADRTIQYFMAGYYVFGFILAFFYDTWLIAAASGSICLFIYLATKTLLPDSYLHRYVASAVLAVFMAQFIYQMHGLFEMHFFAFLGAILLVVYQNWKLQLPLILLVILHHSSFAYLQYLGYKEIYFTQMDYMSMQAFIFHALLASAIVFVCGLWAYQLRIQTVNNAKNMLLLQEQVENTHRSIAFAETISLGNLDTEYHFSTSDELGTSLQKMRNSLLAARVKEEEDKFINIGMAEIGQLLRIANQPLEELSIQLIKNIVKYLQVNQGGLFVVEGDEDPQLVLKGCYAFDRIKHQQKSFKIGEGLLGQVLLEKDSLYLTDLPQNYIQITSGLGKANPTCLLIVALKNNEQLIGAIELASFEDIPAYKRNFMEKIGETIAAALSTARNNQQTASLLVEVQLINEQMRSQEEEMRQNMEELQSTQEELERKVSAYENKLQDKDELIRNLESRLTQFPGQENR